MLPTAEEQHTKPAEPQAHAPGRIDRLEAHLLQLPQVDLNTKHYVTNGIYAREVTMPAGTVVTGATHKTDHILVCVGDVLVWTEDGMQRMTGHFTMCSKAGSRRAVLAIADSRITTFHRTEKTDVREIEDEIAEQAPLLQTRHLGVEQRVTELLEV